MIRRLIPAALLAAALACAPIAATAQKVSDLPAATTLSGPEMLAGAQGSGCATHVAPCASVRISPAQLATYINASLDPQLVALAALSPAADKCVYWTGSTAASLFDCTSFMRGLDGSANAAAARSTLGLGTLATQSGTFSGTSSGTNTGDQTTVTGNAGSATVLQTPRTLAITGDIAWTSPSFDGSGNVTAAGTLPTVNSNVGACGTSTTIPTVTLNAKGLATACTAATASTDIALPIVHPGYVAGRWYWPFGATAQANLSVVVGNANLRLALVLVPQRITVSDLFTRIGTASAGGNIQLGVYAQDASTKYATGAVLASTGNISTTTATVVSATLGASTQLAPGWYWVGAMADNGTVGVTGTATGIVRGAAMIGSTTLGNVSSAMVVNAIAAQYSVTFGTWPNLTGVTPTEVLTGEPMVGFKISSVP